MKILLVSHGEFAIGLERTMRDFFGATNIFSAVVDMESGTGNLIKKVHDFLEEWGDERVFIYSDLKGGSANQAVFPLVEKENVQIITGMNLPLILQLYLEEDSISHQRIEEIIHHSKEEIELLTADSLQSAEEDGDE